MKIAVSLSSLAVLSTIGIIHAQVKVSPGADRISVTIDGKPFGDLIYGKDAPKPYFYPLRTASGVIVTRQWPMQTVDAEKGEKHDHPHHRGLWFAHDEVNGAKFWSADPLNKPDPAFGRIALEKIVSAKSGKRSGSFTALFDWKDSAGKTMLVENRTMTFHDDPKLRIVDVDIALTAKDRVTFGDTKEGTFGIRLNPQLQEQGHSGHIVNAGGAEGEKAVWGKPSEWVDYYGAIDGQPVGIAILDHPQNPGHPVRWHVRAYGLFAANPFGLSDFTRDKSAKGGQTIEPGQTLRYRYRVVIHPGDYKTADIAKLYQEWTHTNGDTE
jgi:hypothetical protein